MNSIRLRLTRKLLLTVLFLLLVGLAVIYVFVRRAVIAGFDTALRTKALAVSTNTEQGRGGVTVQFTDRFMQGFGERFSRDFYEIRGPGGAEIRRSRDLLETSLPDIAGPFEHPQYWNLTLVNGLPGRAVGFTFSARPAADLPEGTEIALLRIVVAGDRTSLDQTLWQLGIILAVTGAMLLAAIVVFLPRILRTELLHLDRLGAQVGKITANSLSARLADHGLPSELVPIADKLNDLLARLEESFARERRFSADLSHELRTPLAELRTWAEYAIMWPESRGDDEEVLGIARQMEGIVSRMLAMARSERGQLPVTRELMDLEPTLQSAWHPFSARAEEKWLSVTFQVAPGSVCTDPVLFRSILFNLFDNAVEYTPAGGAISVVAEDAAKGMRLSVSNSVDGLLEPDIAKLFDRFWRKESSRSGEEHAGLGLSLAREFARTLGWELSALLVESSQLCFRLQGLPDQG